MQEQFCRHCRQGHICKQVYETLRQKRGPSVVSGVLVAFLAPLVVFIGALLLFETALAEVMSTAWRQRAFSFLLSFGITCISMLIIRRIWKVLAAGNSA